MPALRPVAMQSLKAWLQAIAQPVPLVGVPRLPAFLMAFMRFRAESRGARAPGCGQVRLADTYPCLFDRTPATPFDPHYFFQAAWCARRLADAGRPAHIDVGSSVLALSVLSAFVDTVFIDYRPLAAELPGLRAVAGDLTRLPLADRSVTSLSCLHVIEHVGLGRYGDPMDPLGHCRAAAELARVLRTGGCLYLSTPVGRERVCFNAHRVFAAESIVALFGDLQLDEFSLVDDRGALRERQPLSAAAGLRYGCGLFRFRRA